MKEVANKNYTGIIFIYNKRNKTINNSITYELDRPKKMVFNTNWFSMVFYNTESLCFVTAHRDKNQYIW